MLDVESEADGDANEHRFMAFDLTMDRKYLRKPRVHPGHALHFRQHICISFPLSSSPSP